MQIIAKGCGQGKTTELLKIAEDNQYCFVTAHQQMLRRINAMHLNIPKPITFQEFKAQKYRGRDIKGFVIDDVDMLVPNTIWTEQWTDANTQELIKLSAQHWKYISVLNHEVAIAVSKMAKELELEIPFPILYDEIGAIASVLIHDPRWHLQRFASRFAVKVVTITGASLGSNPYLSQEYVDATQKIASQ